MTKISFLPSIFAFVFYVLKRCQKRCQALKSSILELAIVKSAGHISMSANPKLDSRFYTA